MYSVTVLKNSVEEYFYKRMVNEVRFEERHEGSA